MYVNTVRFAVNSVGRWRGWGVGVEEGGGGGGDGGLERHYSLDLIV